MANPESSAKAGTTRKGERTRAIILETALRLFQEHGYDRTTMRLIADQAGVPLGNTYYYFRSKEHLVQAFYVRINAQHRAACSDALARETDLAARLRAVVRAGIEVMGPYHRFAGNLFRTAADPRSPLNPFGPESSAARREGTSLFAEALDGSAVRIPADLRTEIPDLLWLYHMGIILFWIHDGSAGWARTHRLIESTVELVTRLISLAGVPLLRPLRRTTLELLADLRRQPL